MIQVLVSGALGRMGTEICKAVDGADDMTLVGGVDPAARDYILNTILRNYSENASVVLSTHLIGDIEPVLDEAIFLKDGRVFAHRSVEELRETEGMSVDAYFREVFKC